MSTADDTLDRSLDALGAELDAVTAPERVRAQLLKAQAQPARQSHRHRYGLAAAAAIMLGAGLFALPDRQVEQAPLPAVAPDTPVYVVSRAQIPLRSFSIEQGPTTRMVDASIVRDQHGLTRAIYVHQSQ